MPIDRHRIQRADFPARLRGYDRAAVDAHLRALADELEARAGSVAGAAGEQVRAVLAAAEASAAEIRAEARRDTQALHAQASAALDSARGLASREQRDHAERVAASSGATLERLDALRGELAELLQALGRPAQGAPQLIAADEPVAAAPVAAAPEPAAAAPSPAGAAAPEPVAGVASPVADKPLPALARAEQSPAEPGDDERDQLVPDPDAPDASPHPDDPDELVPDPDAPAPHEADEEAEAGARLVALDLALSGAPREQADRYLAEHFAPLDDRGALLDEVYAAAAR